MLKVNTDENPADCGLEENVFRFDACNWTVAVFPLVPKLPQHKGMQASHMHSKPLLFPLKNDMVY